MRKKASRSDIYKEAISRLRVEMELNGHNFAMHDAGIILTTQALGMYAARIGESDELAVDEVILALLDRGALYFDCDGRAQFGSASGGLSFVVINSDALGIWSDEELPYGMQDARGVDLARIRFMDSSRPEERWR